jgi:hypothetical protein
MLQSGQPAPRHDDPGVGLPGFGIFVNKVLGVHACQCPMCEFVPSNTLCLAVQCTAVQYEYTEYGRVKTETIITINLGKPLF